MPKSEKRLEELLEKANSLPSSPGVYIMKDRQEKIIYVGKSRKLKNRVSQYFQNSKKNVKTTQMVLSAEDFDYILCKTEIEALTLENALIKQHAPKYNIKLKDAKAYPYIKITSGDYPRILFTRTRAADKGKYFGPFSGTAAVYSILDILHKSLGIPNCKRSFPKDIGKERPCIYYQMQQCCGLCTGNVSKDEYEHLIYCAVDILKGHTGNAINKLEQQMFAHAEAEQYEAAARCRDTIQALRLLNQKQHVVASPDVNMDVFGLYTEDAFGCISIIQIRDGVVTDKSDFMFGADALIDGSSLGAFLMEHYQLCEYIPKQIIVSFELEEEDRMPLEELFSTRTGHKVEIRRPERGSVKEICQTAVNNAKEKARQSKLDAQKDESVLIQLAELLMLESVPTRIEAYDISNIGNEDITAGMVVFDNGKPNKSDYRSFRIRSVVGQTDDYSSMREALQRRIRHLKEDQKGSFANYPDLIFVDGGKGHVSVAKEVLAEENIIIPVFGMVKDEFHKTRALCTDQEEINIAKNKPIFMLIYKIQEEVHRFTVEKTTQAKRKTLKHSSLEKIDGIGPSKAKKLLDSMGTLSAIKNATPEELSALSGISEKDALAIYLYFHKN